MFRWRSDRRAAAALLGLTLLLAGPARAADEPPDPATVKDADFTSSSIGFTSSSVGFTSSSVGFTSSSVDFTVSPTATPETSGNEMRFQLTADLLFDFDKADLRPEAQDLLSGVLKQIKEKAKKPKLTIEGHTDSKGSDDYNQDLSERRAASVKMWFVKVGKLPAKSIATTGYGERQPVADNEKPDGTDDPEGRQKNRRVEIVVTGIR
ncbi:MAG: OmpA family protein [Geminicoccaceae bacterium]